ncbi:MAG TPA: FAD-binding protein, partial [Solirubrobacteraceae bacterium]
MEEFDRRSFLRSAGAGGVALVAGAELAAPAAAAVRAACRPGPPIPRTIQQAIRGHVFTRSTPGFTSASHVFNTVFDGVRPRFVARPINTADVRAAVRWAVKHHVPMRARSGGHSYAGYSTCNDGLVL